VIRTETKGPCHDHLDHLDLEAHPPARVVRGHRHAVAAMALLILSVAAPTTTPQRASQDPAAAREPGDRSTSRPRREANHKDITGNLNWNTATEENWCCCRPSVREADGSSPVLRRTAGSSAPRICGA
jgi:hypothetical protein